ncbi:hypothetical protein CSOJ01_14422 [Colletotrichum sojae]|uniref:Uncharacterized protein n=1 Tax=Colletotrichum sojae TaxID=2175907 RepID=A0A8H6IQK5_9PEZI|nr:hypothetical protein CSOJ01_14422 [Colletotrichum sojae]
MFPDLKFYFTLLGNRENFLDVWPFAARFHGWVYDAAVSAPSVVDDLVERLEQLRSQLGLNDTTNFFGFDLSQPNAFNYPSLSSVAQDLNFDALELDNFDFCRDIFGTDVPQPDETKQETPSTKPAAQKNPFVTGQEHTLLSSELQKPLETVYRCVINNGDHFRELDDVYNRHVRRESGIPSEEDSTWPRDAETQRQYVGKMFKHIVHTDNFYELRKARERLAIVKAKNGGKSTSPEEPSEKDDGEPPKKRARKPKGGKDTSRAQARPRGVNKSDWELMDENITPAECLKAVTHHEFTNVEIELLCWKLLFAAMEAQKGFTMRPLWAGHRTVTTFNDYKTFADRWNSMCEELMDCKILVHSLTRADWFVKFASAPAKERSAKLNNDLLNGRRDVQNQVGREIIQERTESKDWMTSEDYEIRTKDGQVVCQGSKIGDKTRRQLAIREGRKD